MAETPTILKQFRQFIIYRKQPRPGAPAKMEKIPCDWRTGDTANAQSPAIWTDAATAEANAAALGAEYGVGFVLTESCHLAVVDIDGCRSPQNGELSVAAQGLLLLLSGAYVEVSVSGTGLHIWFTYSGTMPAHACRNAEYGLEFYHRDRFFALGRPFAADWFVNGSVSADKSDALQVLSTIYFPPTSFPPGSREWTEGPCPEWRGPTNDDELIGMARRSGSPAAAFEGKASFADLWLANEPALSRSYPDTNGRLYDASVADAALAQHLSFWTGKDCARIDRLMRQSKLAREKWEREDYLPRTIAGAVSRQVEVLQIKMSPEPLDTSGVLLSAAERTMASAGTQDSVALIFTERKKGEMLYDRTRGAWLVWDGTRWHEDRLGTAFNLIRDIARELQLQYGKAAMGTAAFCEGVNKFLQSAPQFARTTDQFDADNYLLNTPGGTIGLRTGDMRPHSAADMLTKCTPVALSSGGGELFQRFLSQITAGDGDLIQFLQVSLGACLSGAVESHWMLFWTGIGRNGKNTLGDLVQDAMGDYARKVPAATLMAKASDGHPTTIANLQGLRLATSSEINDGTIGMRLSSMR